MTYNILDFQKYKEEKEIEGMKECADAISRRFKRIFEKEKQHDKSNSD